MSAKKLIAPNHVEALLRAAQVPGLNTDLKTFLTWIESAEARPFLKGLGQEYGFRTPHLEVSPSGAFVLSGAKTQPSLQELRERAEDIGVDISHFGRKKAEIVAFLESKERSNIHPDEVIEHDRQTKGFHKTSRALSTKLLKDTSAM